MKTLKNKILIAAIFLTISFSPLVARPAYAGGSLGDVFAAVFTGGASIVIDAVATSFNINYFSNDWAASFLAVNGVGLLAGDLTVGIVLCGTGVTCNIDGYSFKAVLYSKEGNHCIIPLTFYIPDFNINHKVTLSTSPAQTQISCNEWGTCETIVVAPEKTTYVYSRTNIDETNRNIAIYRFSSKISNFIDPEDGEVDSTKLAKWFLDNRIESGEREGGGFGHYIGSGSAYTHFGSGIFAMRNTYFGCISSPCTLQDTPLAIVPYKTFCSGNVCNIPDAQDVPTDSFVVYVAKILGEDYSYVPESYLGQAFEIGCDLWGNCSTPSSVSATTSNKFLVGSSGSKSSEASNTTNLGELPYLDGSDYELGNIYYGPFKTGSQTCEPPPVENKVISILTSLGGSVTGTSSQPEVTGKTISVGPNGNEGYVYPVGTVLSLTATPQTGWGVSTWQSSNGGYVCAGSSTCTFTVGTTSSTITVSFYPICADKYPPVNYCFDSMHVYIGTNPDADTSCTDTNTFVQTCAFDQICSNGVCVCNSCGLNTLSCQDSKTAIRCIDTNANYCGDTWSVASNCDENETCTNGYCTCYNTCGSYPVTPINQPHCSGQLNYRCVNLDMDRDDKNIICTDGGELIENCSLRPLTTCDEIPAPARCVCHPNNSICVNSTCSTVTCNDGCNLIPGLRACGLDIGQGGWREVIPE